MHRDALYIMYYNCPPFKLFVSCCYRNEYKPVFWSELIIQHCSITWILIPLLMHASAKLIKQTVIILCSVPLIIFYNSCLCSVSQTCGVHWNLISSGQSQSRMIPSSSTPVIHLCNNKKKKALLQTQNIQLQCITVMVVPSIAQDYISHQPAHAHHRLLSSVSHGVEFNTSKVLFTICLVVLILLCFTYAKCELWL